MTSFSFQPVLSSLMHETKFSSDKMWSKQTTLPHKWTYFQKSCWNTTALLPIECLSSIEQVVQIPFQVLLALPKYSMQLTSPLVKYWNKEWSRKIDVIQADMPGIAKIGHTVFQTAALAVGFATTATIGLFFSTQWSYWIHKKLQLLQEQENNSTIEEDKQNVDLSTSDAFDPLQKELESQQQQVTNFAKDLAERIQQKLNINPLDNEDLVADSETQALIKSLQFISQYSLPEQYNLLKQGVSCLATPHVDETTHQQVSISQNDPSLPLTSSAKEENLEDIQQQLKSLEEDNERLYQTVSDLKAKTIQLSGQNELYFTQKAKLKDENDQLASENTKLKERIKRRTGGSESFSKLQAQYLTAIKECDQLRTELAEAQENQQKLDKHNQKLKGDLDTAKAKEQELSLAIQAQIESILVYEDNQKKLRSKIRRLQQKQECIESPANSPKTSVKTSTPVVKDLISEFLSKKDLESPTEEEAKMIALLSHVVNYVKQKDLLKDFINSFYPEQES